MTQAHIPQQARGRTPSASPSVTDPGPNLAQGEASKDMVNGHWARGDTQVLTQHAEQPEQRC